MVEPLPDAAAAAAAAAAWPGDGDVDDGPDTDLFGLDSPGALEQSLLAPIVDETGGRLGPFLAEFDKMQQALRKSHESEARFVSKCRELAQQLQDVHERALDVDADDVDNRHKLATLLTQTEVANESRAVLAGDLSRQNERLVSVRQEVAALKAKIETWAQVLVDDQQKVIGAMEQEQGALGDARDKALRHLTVVRGENAALYRRIDHVEGETQRQMDEINDLRRREGQIDVACRQELERKDELDVKTSDLKEQCGQHSLDISRKVERTRKARQELAKDRTQLNDSMKSGGQARARLLQLNDEAQELEDRFQSQHDATAVLAKATTMLEAANVAARASLDDALHESSKKLIMLEQIRERVQVGDHDLESVEATRTEWNGRIEARKMELKAANAAAVVAVRAIDIAGREREVLYHDHGNVVSALSGKRDALHIAENQSRNIHSELKAFDASVKAWKALIDQVAQDTDSFTNQLEAKQARTRKATERSAAKEAQIISMQKTIIEQEARRRQQTNLLEAVKSDRNLYSKALIEQKQEMGELRRVYDGLQHSIIHLQQELNDKETAFVNENLLVEQVDDDIRQTELKSKHVQDCLGSTSERVKAQTTQISQLSRIIDEADEELQAQTKQYMAVVNEERVLNRQLVKRNEELAEVYERLRLHHSMMQKGDLQYRERQDASKKMVALQGALTDELNAIDLDRTQVEQLQGQLRQLERTLGQERLKARALEDELKRPMNIHRWRQLQDTNAETYTLIETVQNLQKSIIAKSGELAAKDVTIEQRERLYVDLRRIQARQLGNEAQEQLRIYSTTMKEKGARHGVMLAELRVCQARVQELRYDIDTIYNQGNLLQVAYFQRRREIARAKSRGTASSSAPGAATDRPESGETDDVPNEGRDEVAVDRDQHDATP